ncbi:tetratricopeptide repeat protein [Lamprobacter modestohalophilus]|uniref:tetratricopeptide repeat protein n=1 Tax=Lamprobacter modestohalophilus TaxID=1064514 RepID=UPI002ADED586|nr:tetratricopeptide repeat protein [Lamprobacter modestohalophilus]MEA1053010.1 tetratricopeptide repeat protein [Lamprobacter modestohalophilus]
MARAKRAPAPKSTPRGGLNATLASILEDLKAGRHGAALAQLQRVQAAGLDDNPRVQHLHGLVLLTSGRSAEALPWLEKAAQAEPSTAAVQENLGVCRTALGDASGALDAFRVALAQWPDKPTLLVNAGTAAQAAGQPDLAEALARRALGQDDTHAPAWFLLGRIDYERLALDQAEEALRRGLALAPKAFIGRDLLGHLHLRRHDYAAALTLFEVMASEWPNPQSLTNHGVSLHHLGHQQASIERYQEALRLFLASGGAQVVPKPKTPMSVEQAHRTLRALKQTLDSLRIPFFLVFGTLLGIVRDGRLLPNDKDLDLALPWATPRAALVDALAQAGFITPAERQIKQDKDGAWRIAVVHLATQISIDLFFARGVESGVEFGVDYLPEPIRWRVRRFALAPLRYQGMELSAPAPAEAFLEDFYGPDWRTPQHYCGVLRGAALLPDAREGRLSFAYNRLMALLNEGNWKKAAAYCRQMKLVIDADPLIDQAQALAEAHLGASTPPTKGPT